MAYADEVLDAVGIREGPSHMEVMFRWTESGTADLCLVEVGARCHGGEGTWLPLASDCIGYTQASPASLLSVHLLAHFPCSVRLA